MKRLFVLFAALLISACAPLPEAGETAQRSAVQALPPMKSFGTARPFPVNRSNSQIAKDFLELSFQMESGRRLPVLTRFEGPVRVSVVAGAPRILESELEKLLVRLRREARIDIARARSTDSAQIVIEAIPRSALQKAVPNAACFVVPNVAGWAEYRRYRRQKRTDWALLSTRTRATVILPSDVSPQEIRDCLHEEIAQALGPLNDLYRLPDSTFNDDNFHTVLTGFDMLILRTYYSPQLKSGMSLREVSARLPGILNRLNPGGRGRGGVSVGDTSVEWNRAISGALSARSSLPRRRSLAKRAVAIARNSGWTDNRLAFSLYVQGRATIGSTTDLALTSFVDAGAIYRRLYGNSIHAAHIATQMSAFALSGGRARLAVSLVDDALPAAGRAQNAALLATLLMIKAEALEFDGRVAQARLVRRDGLAWGRYGFGADRTVRERLREIQALVPAKTSASSKGSSS